MTSFSCDSRYCSSQGHHIKAIYEAQEERSTTSWPQRSHCHGRITVTLKRPCKAGLYGERRHRRWTCWPVEALCGGLRSPDGEAGCYGGTQDDCTRSRTLSASRFRGHEREPISIGKSIDTFEKLQETNYYQSIWEQRNDLGQTFGTKKAKKAIASLTENAIAPGKASGERSKMDGTANVMLNTIGQVTSTMSTRDQLAAAADENKPRPKANLEAAHVKDVYTPESLVGADVLKSLTVSDWAQAVKKKQEIKTKSRFVSRRIVDAAQDTTKLKCLRFALALLAFLEAARSRGRSANKILPQRSDLREALDLPENIIDSIRRRFSERGEMTKFHVDLLITHLCALALVIDNFEVDMYDLGEDLKLESKELGQYFLEVGAVVTEASEKMRKQMGWDKSVAAQRKFAKLKLPLKFPKARFMRKK